MSKHTHRGHCQFCLHVHAIDVESGKLADHGYTINHGMFNGRCPGSGVLSLHVQRTHTDETIAQYRDAATFARTLAIDYEQGEQKPKEGWNGQYRPIQVKTKVRGAYWTSEKVIMPFDLLPNEFQRETIMTECDRLRRTAEHNEYLANLMTLWADRIYDKVDSYSAEELEQPDWVVGDVVRIGGMEGFDAKIEAIENREYRSYGFSRRAGSTMVPHALITHPAIEEKRASYGSYVIREGKPERKVWEPLRNLKRAKVPGLVAELKKLEFI